jgi:hypothetical protein
MKEAPSSSETSVLTRATRRNIQEDTIVHSHRRENLKSYEVSCISTAIHPPGANNICAKCATKLKVPLDKDISTFGLLSGPNGISLRMVSSGMLRRVALARTEVSEEPSASIIRVRRIGEVGT